MSPCRFVGHPDEDQRHRLGGVRCFDRARDRGGDFSEVLCVPTQAHVCKSRQQVCDAPKRPGLHAHYTAAVNMLTSPLFGSCSVVNGKPWEPATCSGSTIESVCLERGMPGRRCSSDSTDYVPAICTHRPSLLQMMLGQRAAEEKSPAGLGRWMAQ